MSEPPRKRSRKSKLVPRLCTEGEDENGEHLQITPELYTKTSKIIKTETVKKSQNEPNSTAIKTTQDDFEALIDSQKKEKSQPQREFSITVAVEEFDESSSELTIIETKVEPEILSSDEEIELTSEEYALDRYTILNAATQILEKSTNPADKILGVEVRNGMGRYQNYIEDPVDNKIQNVLIKWLETQKQLNAKQKSPPLFYKCYICDKSWWYLHNFREHLKEHTDYVLDVEAYTQCEVNIIAKLDGQEIEMKHLETSGNCPKCGYGFEIHRNSANENIISYICKVNSCKKELPTCFLLRQHEYMCHTVSELTGSVYSNAGWKKHCKVCGVVFHTPKSYRDHMDSLHLVRSDTVILWKETSTCQFCKMKCLYGWHDCIKRKILNCCEICKFSFSNNLLLIHNKQKDYTCSICNDVLPKHCMEISHLLSHTNKFVLMKMCVICKEFLLVEDSNVKIVKHFTKFHQSLNLNMTDANYKNFLRMILIPKSCLINKKTSSSNLISSITSTSTVDAESLPVKIKEEPKEMTVIPKIEIKEEIIENFDETGDNEEVIVKEEIDLYDNFEETMRQQYDIKIERPTDHSRIFGIKIEACDIETKEEICDEEYEDDIIKLDENFLNNMPESMQENMVESHMVEMPEVSERGRKPKFYCCNKCGFYGYHREYRNHFKKDCYEKVYDKGNYRCTKCFSTYDMFQKYIEHLSKHHLKKLCCPECFREFSSYQVLLPHISMHIRMTFVTMPVITQCKKNALFVYQCKLCRDEVVKSDFFVHWESHLTFAEEKNKVTSRDGLYEAGIPVKPIDQHLIQQLLQYLQSPIANYLKRGCLICHRHFSRKNDCKRHLIEHLLIDAYASKSQNHALKCQICHKGFQKNDRYKKHMRDHGSLPEYKCELCDKSFSDSSNFTKHKKLHNVNAYTCDTCGKKFQAKFSLEKHVQIHLDQVPIECVVCKKTFYLSSAYRKHYRMKHEKNVIRFPCRICNVKFKCLKEKWDHMWSVHKERKHKADCTKCDCSYRRFSDLRYHMKVVHHTDLKVFSRYYERKIKNATTKIMKSNTISSQNKPTLAITPQTEETLVVYE